VSDPRLDDVVGDRQQPESHEESEHREHEQEHLEGLSEE